jgi:hypothetical protein
VLTFPQRRRVLIVRVKLLLALALAGIVLLFGAGASVADDNTGVLTTTALPVSDIGSITSAYPGLSGYSDLLSGLGTGLGGISTGTAGIDTGIGGIDTGTGGISGYPDVSNSSFLQYLTPGGMDTSGLSSFWVPSFSGLTGTGGTPVAPTSAVNLSQLNTSSYQSLPSTLGDTGLGSYANPYLSSMDLSPSASSMLDGILSAI